VITSPAFQIPLEGSTPGVQIAGIDATPGNGSSSSSVSESIQAPDGLFRPVWTGGNFMINDQFRPESLSGKVLVYEGDTLQSPKDVKISLLHEGGSVIEIAQETKCVLQSNGLYLVDGKISAAIENMTPESFVVETTSARVTHLGTQFTVEMIDGDTRVEVVEGRVSVDSSTIDDKVLFPGQFARITGDGGISYGTIGQVESRMQPRTAPENIEVHFNP